MRTRIFTLSLLLAALASSVGCKKSFPEKYQEYEFTRDGLQMAFDDEHSVTALYDRKSTKQADLVADWTSHLKAKGFDTFCETEFSDGSVAKGFGSKSKRFVFTAGHLGDTAWELHMLEVPDHVKDDEVCPKEKEKK